MIRVPRPYDESKTPRDNLIYLMQNELKFQDSPTQYHCLKNLEQEIQSLLDRPGPKTFTKVRLLFRRASSLFLYGEELRYMDQLDANENLARLLKAIQTQMEPMPLLMDEARAILATGPVDKVEVRQFYRAALVERIIQFATAMQENDRQDVYDEVVEFLQRVRLDAPSYEEVAFEFAEKQQQYAKSRQSETTARYREADFVAAYRKEYNK